MSRSCPDNRGFGRAPGHPCHPQHPSGALLPSRGRADTGNHVVPQGATHPGLRRPQPEAAGQRTEAGGDERAAAGLWPLQLPGRQSCRTGTEGVPSDRARWVVVRTGSGGWGRGGGFRGNVSLVMVKRRRSGRQSCRTGTEGVPSDSARWVVVRTGSGEWGEEGGGGGGGRRSP